MENYGRGLSRDARRGSHRLQTPRPLRNALLRLHENADHPGILSHDDLRLNKDTENWIGFETEASTIRNYQPMYIPGLLQAILAASPYPAEALGGGARGSGSRGGRRARGDARATRAPGGDER